MTVDELYGRYNDMLKGINVTPAQDFVFDLTDDNSQNSLKSAFPGIDALLMPECGNYLVVATVIEDPNCLMLLFPDQSDGSCALKAFNTGTKGYCDLTDPANGQEKLTIDNFKDFANMEDIARRFNEFVFCPGKGSPAEVKDIGSIDITHDEPVEIPTTTTTTTDDEENEMKFKPIQEETELDRETKWVEIPNTNAGGVTVTEDDDPFAGEPGLDPNAPAPEGGDAAGGDAAPADGGAEAAPADGGDAAAPAEGEAPADTGAEAAPAEGDAAGTETIDDPKAKMRELLAYYTNYMNELVQDPAPKRLPKRKHQQRKHQQIVANPLLLKVTQLLRKMLQLQKQPTSKPPWMPRLMQRLTTSTRTIGRTFSLQRLTTSSRLETSTTPQ